MADPTPQITSDDWKFTKRVGKAFGIDPYLLVAIGIHESGWGSKGDGRPPPYGTGHILGAGSFDSGSSQSPMFYGLSNQLIDSAIVLRKRGVHNAADVQAGKLHVTPEGRTLYASADTQAAGYPWSTDVVHIATQLEGTKAFEHGVGLSPTSTAIDSDEQRKHAVNRLAAWENKGYHPSLFDQISNTVGSGVDAATSVVTGPAAFFSWIADRKNWLRVLGVIAGALMILVGILALIRGLNPTAVAAKVLTPSSPDWGGSK